MRVEPGHDLLWPRREPLVACARADDDACLFALRDEEGVVNFIVLMGTMRSASPWRNRVGGWSLGSVAGRMQSGPLHEA